MRTQDQSPEAQRDDAPGAAFAWHVASRLSLIDGEARANSLRAAGILVFYGLEVAAYQGLGLPGFELLRPRGLDEHRVISLLVGAWALLTVAVQVLLRRRFAPPALPYLTTAGDLALLTAVLAVSDGSRSPIVCAYLLVLVMAALRLDLLLMRAATAGAALSWLTLLWITRALGHARPSRYDQCVLLAAVVLAGVMLGQVVRRARLLAEEYAERREREARRAP